MYSNTIKKRIFFFRSSGRNTVITHTPTTPFCYTPPYQTGFPQLLTSHGQKKLHHHKKPSFAYPNPNDNTSFEETKRNPETLAPCLQLAMARLRSSWRDLSDHFSVAGTEVVPRRRWKSVHFAFIHIRRRRRHSPRKLRRSSMFRGVSVQ